MLQSLHVKNLALIDEIEVEFAEGLNILTGETGAGKIYYFGFCKSGTGWKIHKRSDPSGGELCTGGAGLYCDGKKPSESFGETLYLSGGWPFDLEPEINGWQKCKPDQR